MRGHSHQSRSSIWCLALGFLLLFVLVFEFDFENQTWSIDQLGPLSDADQLVQEDTTIPIEAESAASSVVTDATPAANSDEDDDEPPACTEVKVEPPSFESDAFLETYRAVKFPDDLTYLDERYNISWASNLAFPRRVLPWMMNFVDSSGSTYIDDVIRNRHDAFTIGFEPLDGHKFSGPDHNRMEYLALLWLPLDRTSWTHRHWVYWYLACLRHLLTYSDAKFRSEYSEEFVTQSLLKIQASTKYGGSVLALGFKSRPLEFITKPIFTNFVTKINVRVITASRENVVKQAVSLYRRQVHYYSHLDIGKDFSTISADVKVDVLFSNSYYGYLTQVGGYVQNIGRVMAGPVLRLRYEYILKSKHEVLIRVLSFIGMDTLDVPVRTESQYVKASPDRLCDAVKNYGDLCAYVKQHDNLHQWFRYLDQFAGCDCPL